MKHENILAFTKMLLNNFHISVMQLEPPFELSSPPADMGLHLLLNPGFNYTDITKQYVEMCCPNTIYRIKDLALCYYLFFQIPGEEDNYIIIGPYTITPISKENLMDVFSHFSFTPGIFSQLEKYYREIPYLAEEGAFLMFITTLGEWLWDGSDNFSFQNIAGPDLELSDAAAAASDAMNTSKPFVSMNILEKRYADENELMQAVALGQSHRACILLNQFLSRQTEQRIPDTLRSQKNYLIILNTLLRKAVETANVHPLQIDQLSTKYAQKIEQCISKKDITYLSRDMVINYCQLVTNYSLKGYSPLIQKVLAQIGFDLAADLSLNTQAKLLNVNSSYLSTLFKKETGYTLTEYVNKKRIQYAVTLLDTTSMQVQAVAHRCGLPDVNYFNKIFKRYVGKTPKEYRNSIADKLNRL